VGDGLAEEVGAEMGGHRFQFFGRGMDKFDGRAIAGADGLHHFERFLGEAARVEGENAGGGADAEGHVDQNEAFALEAGADGEAGAKAVEGPAEEFFGGAVVEAG
jgi:hypothetical protein